MGMQGFSSEFKSPEHYILDITYRIWELRGLELIHDWYSSDCPVKTPMSVSVGVEPVIAGTQATLDQFPDRELLADDIIVGDWDDRVFYSSHRVRSPCHHTGDGMFGAPTGLAVTMLTIADCICEADKIVDEYLVRDNCGVAIQLGIEPELQVARMIELGNTDGQTSADDLVARWSDSVRMHGDAAVAEVAIQAYHKRLTGDHSWVEHYDRALRFEGSGASLLHGLAGLQAWDQERFGGLSDPALAIHHVIVRADADKPVRIALRWSVKAKHDRVSMFGPAVDAEVALLGASHFELRDGKILNEWMIFDELSLYAQLIHRAGA